MACILQEQHGGASPWTNLGQTVLGHRGPKLNSMGVPIRLNANSHERRAMQSEVSSKRIYDSLQLWFLTLCKYGIMHLAYMVYRAWQLRKVEHDRTNTLVFREGQRRMVPHCVRDRPAPKWQIDARSARLS